MKVFMFIMITVLVHNVANASDVATYTDCMENEEQLIIENADSYTVQELKQQRDQAVKHCIDQVEKSRGVK